MPECSRIRAKNWESKIHDSPQLQLIKASGGRDFRHFLLSMHLADLLRECRVKSLIKVTAGDLDLTIGGFFKL